jgi:galactose oxidase
MRSTGSARRALVAIALAAALYVACDDPARQPERGITRPRSVAQSAAVAADPVDGRVGRWAAVPSFPRHVAIHAHLLPNGRVMFWPGEEGRNHGQKGYQYAFTWDPSTNAVRQIDNKRTNVFCSGHTLLPDGRLLVAGGHVDNGVGTVDANVYDYVSERWTRATPMSFARWYPTSITLANGEALTMGGTATGYGDPVRIAEVYETSGRWRSLSGAGREVPYYPWVFVTPKGDVFYAGSAENTGFVDPSGSGRWDNGPITRLGRGREYGSAVMYDTGRVMIAGGANGGQTPTNTAELLDLNEPGAEWQWTGSMELGRRHMNLTILPDGRVLATGGTSLPGFNPSAGSVLSAEVWDRDGNSGAGSWTKWASMSTKRLYHSTALLLPDGRVLSAGGGRPAAEGDPVDVDHPDADVLSPPYLFDATTGAPAVRPRITEAPAIVAYNQGFVVRSPDTRQVKRVTWIRLGSVTHTFNMGQRFMSLAFGADTTAGVLTVTAPGRAALAPPGHYMLFLLDAKGVPSIARIVQIR